MTTSAQLEALYIQRQKNREDLVLRLVASVQAKLGADRNDPTKVKQSLQELFLKLLKQYTARNEKEKKAHHQTQINQTIIHPLLYYLSFKSDIMKPNKKTNKHMLFI
jgi:hypothetical protein